MDASIDWLPVAMPLCRRYVGDMLAWVHQAIANEKELFTSLFAPSPPSQLEASMGPSLQIMQADPVDSVQVTSLLDKVCAFLEPGYGS
jgi:hypothetical protein